MIDDRENEGGEREQERGREGEIPPISLQADGFPSLTNGAYKTGGGNPGDLGQLHLPKPK